MSVKCPKCQTNNPSDNKYCKECATPLPGTKEVSVFATETLETPIEELTTGSLFAGRYQIIEELGQGGMGRVYKVHDTDIREKVALKLIKPEIASDLRTIERFQNELKFARKIRHQNICQMYDINKAEGRYYITMEYVSGDDLKGMIRMMGRLSAGQAITIAKQVCEGLAEAHRSGVIHRDLKPSNIMIDREGTVRIMDFGIARSLKSRGITGAGMMVGTPEYMSPEQVEGKEADERSDIYALGVILYEMLTGRVPFEGDTPFVIGVKHKSEIPQDPKDFNPQISEDLSSLILRSLEKDKERRYQKAGELLAELAKIEKGIPTADKVLPRGKPLTSKEITVAIKKRWKSAAAVVLVAVLSAVTVLYLRREKPLPAPEKKRLVVLPFENLGLPEDEYFADGITDEIMVRLTGIRNLSVIARNSAMQYKKTQKTIKQIGEELGVDYVLSGTIRWQKLPGDAGRVRVTPTLIQASDSTHIWAEVYDESLSGVFQVQSDVSKKVVEALGVALLEPEKEAIEARPTENMEAYDFYLRGNDYLYQGVDDERQNRLAIEMYERAVTLDPNFFQAYSQLARMHANYYWYHFDRSENRVRMAKEAADKAFKINPDAPETHIAFGYYYYHGRLDYDQALRHFALAREKQPQNAAILEGIAYVKRRQGKVEEAASYLEQAAEIDPRSLSIAYNLAGTYIMRRKYEKAEYWYNRALFLNPDYVSTYAFKTWLYLLQGETTKARQTLEDAAQAIGVLDENLIVYQWILVDIFERKYQAALDRLSLTKADAFENQFYFVTKTQLYGQIYGLMNMPEKEKAYYEEARKLLEAKIKENPDDSRIWSALGIALAGLGLKKEAIQSARKATEILPVSKEAWRGVWRAEDLARVYTLVGEYDKAFDLVEYLLSIPGYMSLAWLRIDPAWTPLLSLPRFQKLK